MGSFRILLLMAFRSLRGHKIKVAIVGSLLAFGSFLLVLGTTLLQTIEEAMEASITESLTGQIQLVSSKAKDQLTFFGPAAASEQDLDTIEDFERIRARVEGIEGVRAVVPMGRYFGQPILGSELDEAIEAVERSVESGDARQVESSVVKLRRMLVALHESTKSMAALDADQEEAERRLADLERAISEEFWAAFEEDPEEALTFLVHHVAKLGGDGASHPLPFLGTDLDHFAESFEHFEIVEGEMPPAGERGFLANKPFYEEYMKNKAARAFDLIHEARSLDGRTLADDPALQDIAAQLSHMTTKVTLDLDPEDEAELQAKLAALFPDTEPELDALVGAFLQVDDENFDERYAFFYEEIAPRIRLYRVPVGSTFTLRSITKSGYPKAVNLKLWGTFRFKGLERSILASAYSLVDMATFRELLGLMTAEKRQELDAIRSELDLADVDADAAEDLFFGGDVEVVDWESEALDLDRRLEDLQAMLDAEAEDTVEEKDDGIATVIHAAVLLHDRNDLEAVAARIDSLSEAEGLGIRAVPWIGVTGFIGQLIMVLRAILYVLIGIIFVVAMVIINNSMVMATMDRIGEIGTMRAIGARRRFVLSLFLLETLVLGVVSSLVGAGAANAILGALGSSGIPARGDFFIFLFGGPALHPSPSVGHALWALLVILVVSVLSTLYPARLAAKVAPVVAMQKKE